jgi:enoyl-CoA hydratase
MYSIEAAVDAGLIDEAIDEKNLMEAAMLKAKDLATMGHPSYTLTKELFISELVTKINNALDELEKNV